MNVYHNNALTSDIGVLLDTWREAISSLYNNARQETDFYARPLRHKLLLEQIMEAPDYQENEYLKEPLFYDEVENVVKLQSNKAIGIDQIPNEILQKPCIINSLYIFLKKCFVHSGIPTTWLKAVIIPIPKRSSKDPSILFLFFMSH